jgi:hypothetical protein
VARRPLEGERIDLDGGRRTTQLMRDPLGVRGAMLKWREVDFPALQSALSSGHTYFVPPELRPPWAQELPTVKGAWLHYVGGQLAGSTGSLNTQAANARLDTERLDPASPELLKYDRYYLTQMSDGRVFQLGPFKDLDYGHHLRERPAWA